MMRPTVAVPIRTIPAPIPVIRIEIAHQTSLPKIPARPKAITERKKRREPTITLGWPIISFTLEIKKAKERKMKGKNIADQEK